VRRGSLLGAAAALLPSVLLAAAPERLADGLLVAVGNAFLKVEVCADNVVRVAYAKDRSFFARPSLAAAPKRCGGARWDLASDAAQATLSTSRLKARVDLASGAVTFLDAHGNELLAEQADGRALTPAVVQGDATFNVRQRWKPADESLYGLGQHHLGLVDIKGYDIDLWQHNGTVVVPFLVGSRGWGVLWDNTSYSRFGDLRSFEAPPSDKLYDATGKAGGLTGTYFAGETFDRRVATRVDRHIDIAVPGDAKEPNLRIHPDLPPTGPASVRWEGEIEATATGDHLIQTFSNNGIKLWLDDRLLVDHWRQGWLPWLDVARLGLTAGRRYRLRLEWTKDQGMETVQLLWKTPAADASTSLWSEVGEGIDYYFVYGPELDAVVAGYRRLTGEAPLLPRWAFGFWQSRQRYKTAQESLDVLAGFRSRRIPIDTIVQDWFYWKDGDWGSHEFDRERFPDPEGWIRRLHELNAKLVISVWPKFYPGTKNFAAMRARGFLYEPNLGEDIRDWLGFPDTFYDAFNAEARQLFWSQVEPALFGKGIDGWWMDASEPDLTPTPTLAGQRSHVHPTALGVGARVLNAYSLVNSQGIYEGQRAVAPDRRVLLLTRSGFAGQQRYGAAVWSGDISSTWTAMQKQVAAGLGFSISGMPWWTMDIGGFSVPARFAKENPAPEDAEEWRELNARWFQWGTFVPLLRVHGEAPNREMWFLGGESHPAYQTQLKFDRLRYRLLPYVYSLAAEVTHAAGTMLRPLVMDFRNDPKARDVRDQFLFGRALLVNPVMTYKARRRPVYLPAAAGWYDFWTGAWAAGGQTIDAPAPYDSLPLYVRAGSILPLGPELQYTSEKPPDPITLMMYAGADGQFALYEDDGTTYAYERGQAVRIPLSWNDNRRTLTIGARSGTFPGTLAERTFEIILVSKASPVGFSFQPEAQRRVRYRGTAVDVRF
jgi:alpha-D-xyloside xylohydrolase